jgi:hypothetical protein
MLTTSLIGRKVREGFSGTRGTIVAMWIDRGEAYVAIESPIYGAKDERTQLTTENLCGTILMPDDCAQQLNEETTNDQPTE